MLSSTRTVLGLDEFFDSGKGWVWNDKELPTGRAWLSAELRNKSFDDLHKLWWVCIKELNKLYSQRDEARRFSMYFPHVERIRQLTMGRIKNVLWGRRQAWLQAQHVLKIETARIELRSTGMGEAEIEAKLKEMFPKTVEEAGKSKGRKRMTMKTSRVQKYPSRSERSGKSSIWTVV
nr:39S ribosomal protein L47, mitochondrial [Polyrhizophydium stewartii]